MFLYNYRIPAINIKFTFIVTCSFGNRREIWNLNEYIKKMTNMMRGYAIPLFRMS
jgi:hypothetical protein